MYPEGSLSTSTVTAELLASNARWAAGVTKLDPNFFPNSAKGQSPKVLWIGCSDSRVPESVITASKPGDIFTTRNIAGQFPVEDLSAHSVLQFAVNGLQSVDHVIVVGHTGCGGVKAALDAARNGVPIMAPLDKWLAPLVNRIKETPHFPNETLSDIVKVSVKMQIDNILKTATSKIYTSPGKSTHFS